MKLSVLPRLLVALIVKIIGNFTRFGYLVLLFISAILAYSDAANQRLYTRIILQFGV